MSNNVFALAARAEQAALHLERARLTVEARRAEVEAAKLGVETARAIETDARATLEAVLNDAEGLGLNKRVFKQAADDRLQSLIGSGLLLVTPFGEGDDAPAEAAPAARAKPARGRAARGDAAATEAAPAPAAAPAVPDVAAADLPPAADEVVVLHADANATLVEAASHPDIEHGTH